MKEFRCLPRPAVEMKGKQEYVPSHVTCIAKNCSWSGISTNTRLARDGCGAWGYFNVPYRPTVRRGINNDPCKRTPSVQPRNDNRLKNGDGNLTLSESLDMSETQQLTTRHRPVPINPLR